MSSTVQDSAAAMAGKNGHSLIGNEKFRQLFQALVESRLLNEHLRTAGRRAVAPNREAGPAGLVLDLRPEDTVLLPSPTHFAHRVKGAPLKALLDPPDTETRTAGVETAATLRRRLRDALVAAVDYRMEERDGIVLLFFELTPQGAHSNSSRNGKPKPEPATLSAGDTLFSLAVAGKLPILFILESHTGIADSTAFRQTHPALPWIAVDAHDLVAVYRVAQESIVRTREGSGPAIIELASLSANGDDPVDKMRRYLLAKGLPAERWKSAAVRRFEKELSRLNQLDQLVIPSPIL